MPCLDDAEALAFVEGACTAERRTAILSHVETCADCSALIQGLIGGDAPSEPSLLPETVGDFRIGKLIAEGGMGRIYEATDVALGRRVAIKVPRTDNEALMRRFEREATITARLQHPGIVPLHAAGKLPDGTPFYVMRLIDGVVLDKLIGLVRDREARLALVAHLVAIVDTMAYVHAAGVVHRDLKPNNVLVGKFGEVVIIDWGLAKQLEAPRDSQASIAPPSSDLTHTRVGAVLGTPTFMAPEQEAGTAVDARADVFALGTILRCIWTGEVQPRGEVTLEGASDALVAVWIKATARAPADRFADAGEMAAALEAALDPAPRPRRALLISATVVAAALAGGGALLWRSHAPHVLELERIGQEPADTKTIAISPSGERVAYVGHDRIEVRDLGSRAVHTHTAHMAWPNLVQFAGETGVDYPVMRAPRQVRVRWNPDTDTTVELDPSPRDTFWFGSVATGELVLSKVVGRKLELHGTSGVKIVPGNDRRPVRIVAISPSRERFAYLDGDGLFTGEIRVVDARSLTARVSPQLPDLSALALRDDNTVLYATGTPSTLYAATTTADGLARPTALFTLAEADAWIGGIAASPDRLLLSITTSTFESHVFTRSNLADVPLDKSAATAPLAWGDGETFFAWNGTTHRVEIRDRDPDALPVITKLRFDRDPASATRAGDMLIVTERDQQGRWIEAFSLADGTRRWASAANELVFVRCAGDVAPPCVAGRIAGGADVELVQIDPTNGKLGAVVVAAADIGDAAIDRAGEQVAWILDNDEVYTRALAGGQQSVIGSGLSGVQTIAFDPRGGVIASAVHAFGRHLVAIRGAETTVLVDANIAVISLVRPNLDGSALIYRTRTFAYYLGELK